MNLRRLGRTDLTLPPWILGAMWHRLRDDDAARSRLVHEAIDRGVVAIDTAPLYEFGGSEAHLGRALEGHRERVLLLGKVGLRWDSDHGRVLFEAWLDGGLRPVRCDSRPDSVQRDVEGSLARLRTDRLDLVQIHQRDVATPLEETFGALLRLREEGKVREIGVCNFAADDLRRASACTAAAPLASAQEHWSLVSRRVEAEVVPAARELEVGVLAYSPLEGGLLSERVLRGDPVDASRGPLFHPKNVALFRSALRDAAQPIAEQHACTVSEVALAWLHHQEGLTSVICGASSSEQLEANCRAAGIALSDAERSRLGECFGALAIDWQPGASFGERARQWLRRSARAVRRRLPGGGAA